jgi:hypothetical protein
MWFENGWKGAKMHQISIATAFLALALAIPAQEVAAQDALGGAIIGGGAGALIGGALGGKRGAVVGAIVGGSTGAAIAAQGQARPGGYYYYQNGCYMQRPDGAWVVVAPNYCAPAAPVAVVQPPPRVVARDTLGEQMLQFRQECEEGERRACVRLGILIGENRQRREAWRREHPEVFFYER